MLYLSRDCSFIAYAQCNNTEDGMCQVQIYRSKNRVSTIGAGNLLTEANQTYGRLKARSHCTCFMVMKHDETGQ